jgi:hypothetical protein
MLQQQGYGMMEIGGGGGEIDVTEGKKNKSYCLAYDKSDVARLLNGGRRIFMINTVKVKVKQSRCRPGMTQRVPGN